ncbi:phosphoglycerate mutase [Coccidioides immitis RS]|uniref:Phosphoglycerate mutase n=3 Tax=Coccidioides immitis TaxID=5501 RepID=J3KFZ2_COCIM|nr:phosphoglycerate mutase [Coccidioides immitis RS]EAS34593.3 phosphoglycerate mutase [Coccidioides immitis RS]
MLASPFLLVSTVLITPSFVRMGDLAPVSHLEYSTVTGYFLQDDPATDPTKFDYASTGFGLINQTYDTDELFDPDRSKSQWERFKHKVLTLNRDAGPEVRYALLYLGRHGQGYHNVAESHYGTAAWDCYWSMLDGNGTTNWADAHLTDQGIADAKVANETWVTQMKNGIPVPQTYYTSPLSRCLDTAKITFSTLDLPKSKPFVPTVKELLRETIGVHTCDRRSSRTYIQENYPTYIIEPGFAESDSLWVPNLRESSTAHRERLRTLLSDVFTHDNNTFISMTAHSGTIRSILGAVGHRDFALPPGAVIPVFVRVEKKPGQAPHRTVQPWTPPPECTVDPTAAPQNLN